LRIYTCSSINKKAASMNVWGFWIVFYISEMSNEGASQFLQKRQFSRSISLIFACEFSESTNCSGQCPQSSGTFKSSPSTIKKFGQSFAHSNSNCSLIWCPTIPTWRSLLCSPQMIFSPERRSNLLKLAADRLFGRERGSHVEQLPLSKSVNASRRGRDFLETLSRSFSLLLFISKTQPLCWCWSIT